MQNRCDILLAYQGGLEVVSIALRESAAQCRAIIMALTCNLVALETQLLAALAAGAREKRNHGRVGLRAWAEWGATLTCQWLLPYNADHPKLKGLRVRAVPV